MVAFVLEQEKEFDKGTIGWKEFTNNTITHAKFLSQKPELWMFVPAILVDGKWIVLKEPERSYSGFTHEQDILTKKYWEDVKQFQQAKERVIFDGWKLYYKDDIQNIVSNQNMDNIYFRNSGHIQFNHTIIKTIEDLVPYNLILK